MLNYGDPPRKGNSTSVARSWFDESCLCIPSRITPWTCSAPSWTAYNSPLGWSGMINSSITISSHSMGTAKSCCPPSCSWSCSFGSLMTVLTCGPPCIFLKRWLVIRFLSMSWVHYISLLLLLLFLISNFSFMSLPFITTLITKGSWLSLLIIVLLP